MPFKIPIYQPSLTGNEKKYVLDCLDSTWISSKGKYIPLFENSFADFIGVRHAASVCNGTVALHLALLALGIGPGDEVIVPTLTYISSVNAITYTGATPVFVDSLPDTWQMDPNDVKNKISEHTKGVMVVHLYGHPCDMDSLVSLTKEHGLYLIEDCAESIGSKYKGINAGTFGNIAAFSFFGNKTITTGEGGMVVTNDETLYQRVVHFKGQGLAKYREYWHDVIGYNYRMTNICAAIGLAQLEQVDRFIEMKQEIARQYINEFENSPVQFQNTAKDVFNTYWMCSVLVPDASQREPLREYLKEKGIETRPLFYPVHTMPMYAGNFQRHVIAEDLAWRGINLPSYPGLTSEQIKSIADLILDFINK